ncbi:MAG: FliA/WhiG family RNA polymerase sigma factor [Planctomycetota bacterium]
MSAEVAHTESLSEEERERLIIDHVPLLKHVVGRMFFDVPGTLDRDDLFGFGILGLIAAADSWDPSRGLAFSTFAYPRIRGAILDELRRMDFLPRGRRERVRAVEATIERLLQTHGRRPTPEAIADDLGWRVNDVDEVFAAASAAVQTSLDASDSDDGAGVGSDLAAMLSDPRSEDPVGSAEFEELKHVAMDAIEELPEQERTVITLYYAEELLLREIADILGVTESRVSQIHARAIYRLNRVIFARTGEDESGRRIDARV